MLDYLVDDNDIQLTPDEVRFIKDLIAGTKKHSSKQ
jgi:deoxynucleoside triphosphate triphosphohydrolase SAMHD1